MSAPGVIVQTATRTGPTGAPRAASGQYFTVGLTERGPIGAPVKVTSLADYRAAFGNRVSYGTVYDDLALYFEAGGAQAWVLRATGPGATSGTLQLSDGAATPVATLRFDAASPGAWSSGLTVQVEAGDTAGTRKITLRLGGVIVAQYNNLADLATIASRFAGSPYVVVTDLGSPTVAPNNLPAVSAATALSAGTDDRANVNAARIEALLPQVKIGLGDGAIAVPGFGQAVHAALIAHAAANRRIAILGVARGTSVSDLAGIARALSTAYPTTADFAELACPFIQVSDGSTGTRFISPEGYFAAARSRAHETVGPWQPGAAELSVTPAVVGVDQEFTRADAEVLDAARVNPVRLVQGRIRIYGARSLSPNDADFSSITIRDLLNRLVTECEARLEPFVLTPIDGRGQRFAAMKGVLIGVLEPIRQAGGIFEQTDSVSGDILDAGYSVDVSRNLNTADVLARNEVRAVVAARPAPNASLISLTIVKVGLTASV